MRPETQAIHTGRPSGPSAATSPAICQSTAFSYDTAQELADVFAGRGPGYIYSRLGNPTTAALEARLAHLEGGLGCIATASGMAAISSVAVGLLRSGDEVAASSGIFGGTVSLFERTLRRFAVRTEFFDAARTDRAGAAITEKTKFIFAESITNPGMEAPDIPALAALARRNNIPLVVDNTAATPALCTPGAFGADIVVHSTSKFINGHGTAIGGAVIDCGSYDWETGVFGDLRDASRRAGQMAFLGHLRSIIYRDLGGCPAPMNSFLMLQGLETLPARMKIHCDNAAALAEFLLRHPKVGWVNYPALEGNPFRGIANRQFGGRGGGLLTFALGDREKAFRFIDSARLALNAVNLGDARTLVCHPASTIFHEFSEAERVTLGAPDDMVRVSVGLEHRDDIIDDFETALQKV